MKKLVDGQVVNMSAAEAAEVQAQWAAAEAEKAAEAAKPQDPTVEDRLAVLEILTGLKVEEK